MFQVGETGMHAEGLMHCSKLSVYAQQAYGCRAAQLSQAHRFSICGQIRTPEFQENLGSY